MYCIVLPHSLRIKSLVEPSSSYSYSSTFIYPKGVGNTQFLDCTHSLTVPAFIKYNQFLAIQSTFQSLYIFSSLGSFDLILKEIYCFCDPFCLPPFLSLLSFNLFSGRRGMPQINFQYKEPMTKNVKTNLS